MGAQRVVVLPTARGAGPPVGSCAPCHGPCSSRPGMRPRPSTPAPSPIASSLRFWHHGVRCSDTLGSGRGRGQPGGRGRAGAAGRPSWNLGGKTGCRVLPSVTLWAGLQSITGFVGRDLGATTEVDVRSTQRCCRALRARADGTSRSAGLSRVVLGAYSLYRRILLHRPRCHRGEGLCLGWSASGLPLLLVWLLEDPTGTVWTQKVWPVGEESLEGRATGVGFHPRVFRERSVSLEAAEVNGEHSCTTAGPHPGTCAGAEFPDACAARATTRPCPALLGTLLLRIPDSEGAWVAPRKRSVRTTACAPMNPGPRDAFTLTAVHVHGSAHGPRATSLSLCLLHADASLDPGGW